MPGLIWLPSIAAVEMPKLCHVPDGRLEEYHIFVLTFFFIDSIKINMTCEIKYDVLHTRCNWWWRSSDQEVSPP